MGLYREKCGGDASFDTPALREKERLCGGRASRRKKRKESYSVIITAIEKPPGDTIGGYLGLRQLPGCISTSWPGGRKQRDGGERTSFGSASPA